MLFVDGTHLSGPYEGTLMAAIAQDADNHLFDIAYAIVSGETKEEWLWFLTVLQECLGELKPVIMSDRNEGLLYAVPKVFGLENHTYCARHLRDNFLGKAAKLGIRRDASKDLLKEMFNRLTYAPTGPEYEVALGELRHYKVELARWVEDNEPERWVQSKFTKERWGKLNNNPAESWNNWMCGLRQMSIPSLISGHLQKLGCKMDRRKHDVEKWKNGVGERVEKALKKIYAKIGSVINVQRYNRGIGEYSVTLTNNRCVVVKLSEMTCSCKWWQLRGLPCAHAMAIIEWEKLSVYDYVYPCYKAATQKVIYLNVIHPMETYDSGVVDDNTSLVVGGDEPDEDFNKQILPPKNS